MCFKLMNVNFFCKVEVANQNLVIAFLNHKPKICRTKPYTCSLYSYSSGLFDSV